MSKLKRVPAKGVTQHSNSTPSADSDKEVPRCSRINQCTSIGDVEGAQRGPSPNWDGGREGSHVKGGFLGEVSLTPPSQAVIPLSYLLPDPST